VVHGAGRGGLSPEEAAQATVEGVLLGLILSDDDVGILTVSLLRIFFMFSEDLESNYPTH
jgi:hypothetical protein